MRTIVLHFEDDVLNRLRSSLAFRGMTGNAYGLLDAFMYRLLENVVDGVPEWTPKPKGDVD